MLAVAFDAERERAADRQFRKIALQARHIDRLPRIHCTAVEGQQQVARAQAGMFGRGIAIDRIEQHAA